MSDYTHATWLLPRGVSAGWLLNASVTTTDVEKFIRLEVPDSAFWDDCAKLQERGIAYHLWQEGHLGSYGPSVQVWMPGMSLPLETSCDEDGHPVVRISLHPDGAIKFDDLAKVLEYLATMKAYVEKYQHVADMLDSEEASTARVAQIYRGDCVWETVQFASIRKGDRFRLVSADGSVADDGEEAVALSDAYITSGIGDVLESNVKTAGVLTVSCDVVEKVGLVLATPEQMETYRSDLTDTAASA